MEVAEVLARRATCYRNGVGALLVDGKVPISWGYNGPPSGEPHCFGEECPLDDCGHCTRALHAEHNALNLYTTIDPNSRLTLYTTGAPCSACAEEIIDFQGGIIHKVVYKSAYSNSFGLSLIHAGSKIELFRLTSSGYMIDHRGNMFESHEVN